MPFIPGRTFVLALVLPLGVAAVSAVDPTWVGALVWLNLAIFAVAGGDLFWARRPGFRVRRRVPPHGALARSFAVELEIESHLPRATSIDITEDIPSTARAEGLPRRLSLEPGTVRRFEYRIRPMERGPLTIGACWLRYPSPGGFWIRQQVVALSDDVRIFPDVQAIRYWELLARTGRNRTASRLTRHRGGDTEFERLRDHQRDDEFRRIDWRATARRRRLTVREYQLEQNQSLVVMLDCGRTMTGYWSGLSALDHALNATLMLAHVAARRGDKVGLVAFGERVERFMEPRGGRSAVNQIVRATYDLFPQMVEANYEEAFRAVRRRVAQRTLVVAITHALDEPTAARLRQLTRELLPRHLPLVVLLRDSDLEDRAKEPATDDASLGRQAAAAEHLLFRDRLVLELERAGVLVLDTLHRDLTGALLARYLEIKARGLI